MGGDLSLGGMKSLYPLFTVDSVHSAGRFYVEHFGMKPVFEADWYVQLHGPETTIQLAFIAPEHPTVPEAFRYAPARGTILSIEVDDATAFAGRAEAAGLTVVQPLKDEPFGQRHIMIEDPNGLLVDVIELIPMDADWLAAQSEG